MQRIRVRAGWVFGAVFLWWSDPTPLSLTVGLAVAATGLGLRGWAAGHLRKHESLATTGPYRWTRNPLYLGSCLLGFGFSLASARWWLAVLFLVLFPLVYLPVIRREEEELKRVYGKSFEAYRRTVPRLFPLPGRGLYTGAGDRKSSNFQWKRAIMNREHHAVIGYVVVSALLLIKLWWR